MDVVGLDPGYRNLGAVRFRLSEGKVTSVWTRVVDVGRCQNSSQILVGLHGYLQTQPFKGAFYVAIENQDIGRKTTTPDNMGVMYMLAQGALNQGAIPLILHNSTRTSMSGLKLSRKIAVKERSRLACHHLLRHFGISQAEFYGDLKPGKRNHVDDAACYALGLIKKMLECKTK